MQRPITTKVLLSNRNTSINGAIPTTASNYSRTSTYNSAIKITHEL